MLVTTTQPPLPQQQQEQDSDFIQIQQQERPALFELVEILCHDFCTHLTETPENFAQMDEGREEGTVPVHGKLGVRWNLNVSKDPMLLYIMQQNAQRYPDNWLGHRTTVWNESWCRDGTLFATRTENNMAPGNVYHFRRTLGQNEEQVQAVLYEMNQQLTDHQQQQNKKNLLADCQSFLEYTYQDVPYTPDRMPDVVVQLIRQHALFEYSDQSWAILIGCEWCADETQIVDQIVLDPTSLPLQALAESEARLLLATQTEKKETILNECHRLQQKALHLRDLCYQQQQPSHVFAEVFCYKPPTPPPPPESTSSSSCPKKEIVDGEEVWIAQTDNDDDFTKTNMAKQFMRRCEQFQAFLKDNEFIP